MLPRRRGFQSVNVHDKTRTHMLFSTASDRSIAKRKRRPHNRFHQMQQHKRDDLIQTGPTELDPMQWTGNQRVIHFGPMAQRDPFFYFYPKGWDLLYPAHFGFFPYRTNKYRGSSAVICVWAFGMFFMLGGAMMVYLGYFLIYQQPFWRWTEEEAMNNMIPPVQIAGPILLALGILLVLIAIFASITTSQFLSDKLRHHHHGDQPASVTVYTTHYQQPRAVYEVNPYQPMPPPVQPIMENPNARTYLVDPNKEMKLFPPVVHGHSTLSLQGQPSPSFVASPYNTLRAVSMHSSPSVADLLQTESQQQQHHIHFKQQSSPTKRKRNSSTVSISSAIAFASQKHQKRLSRRRSSSEEEAALFAAHRQRKRSLTGVTVTKN
uniref:Uncharacterized protein n=1 Tax=Meloidogyne javanica TaxID=6303 RepID=A0A915ME01_MELJA